MRSSTLPEDLFDTNILIDDLNGFEAANQALRSGKHRAISIVTWMEVMAGAEPQEEETLAFYLQGFEILPITDSVARESARVRRDTRMKLPDAIILATAQVAGRVLVTRNTKDFHVGMAGVRIPYTLPTK